MSSRWQKYWDWKSSGRQDDLGAVARGFFDAFAGAGEVVGRLGADGHLERGRL